MYQGCKPRPDKEYPEDSSIGIPELARLAPPDTDYAALWENDRLHGTRGDAAVVSQDGAWEEYWSEGELWLIRAARPITRVESEGELLQYRNIAPFEKTNTDAQYRSQSRRLEWNYLHEKLFGADGGIDRDGDSKGIKRFKGGYLDGDTFTKAGKRLVKPAYEEEGHLEYWRHGLLHRDNGQPAVIAENGRVKEWWVNGVFIKAEQR